LKEVILVNDASTKKDLYDMLENHIKAQPWGEKVKLLMMNERSGLIWSRLAGARYASGDVLLFLDCHMEAGYNFMPPLIDPIVENYRAVVTPTLDIIDKNDYGIKSIGVGRTVFDWSFHVQRIPLKNSNHSEIFQTPIMYGAAFAISAKYFWELQPDSGLRIYGGDQLEMSLKINLCGGILYEAPCSRMAHLYRRFPYRKHQNGVDYKAR
jgi:polypeptide N-acetylgalactosaminyltransferase